LPPFVNENTSLCLTPVPCPRPLEAKWEWLCYPLELIVDKLAPRCFGVPVHYPTDKASQKAIKKQLHAANAQRLTKLMYGTADAKNFSAQQPSPQFSSKRFKNRSRK
jgi:hypothetical protein